MKVEVHISCVLCPSVATVETEIPDGWDDAMSPGSTAEIYNERSFTCPEHPKVGEWRSHNCPGCVGGWGDCSLFEAFAYRGRRKITHAQLEEIRRGVCPYRTNGTFMMQGESFLRSMDLRAPLAPPEAQEGGRNLAEAIEGYIERYKID